MTLAELYEIGKASRSAASSLKRAAYAAEATASHGHGGGSKSLVVELDEKGEEKEDGKGRTIAHLGDFTGRGDGTGGGAATSHQDRERRSAKGRPRCMICRERESKYNCPNCNIAYCSLKCYQSASGHATCSQSFLRATLQTELGQNKNAVGNGGHVDEGERKAMMDLLRRFNMSEEADVDGGGVEGKKDGGFEEEAGIMHADNPEIDLGEYQEVAWCRKQVSLTSAPPPELLPSLTDHASLQELMSLLSAEERDIFQAAVNDSSQSKAKALMEKLMRQETYDGEEDQVAAGSPGQPWWSKSSNTSSSSAVEAHQHVCDSYDSALKLSQQRRREVGGKIAALEYNIIAILLAYALVIRHLDVECLSELTVTSAKGVRREGKGGDDHDDMPPLEPSGGQESLPLSSDEDREAMRSVAIAKCTHLLPYLQPLGPESKMVLGSAEDASLFIAARMGGDAGAGGAAAALHFLYQDVLAILSPPRIVEVSSTTSTARHRVALALCDLSSLFSAPIQRKLLFYAAYWLRLDNAEKQIEVMVTAERDRIQGEIDRAEDEERFLAAHQASEQHISLS